MRTVTGEGHDWGCSLEFELGFGIGVWDNRSVIFIPPIEGEKDWSGLLCAKRST